MRHRLVFAAAVLVLAGCPRHKLPSTSSEIASGSSYVPLSPKPIELMVPKELVAPNLLDALPNVTMRISVGSLDQSSSLTFGAGSMGQEGSSYRIVADYLQYTTAYLPVCYRSSSSAMGGKYVAGQEKVVIRTEFGSVEQIVDTRVAGQDRVIDHRTFSIDQRVPVYVGIGLRIEAQVHVLKGKIELNLFSLGAAADAGQVSGTMVIQTLGVFGEPITPLIPMPNDISQASIQAAMQALAAIKAKLYDDKVKIKPQVVGFESSLRSTAAVQLIDATLSGATVKAEYYNGEIWPKLIGEFGTKCGDPGEAKQPSEPISR